MNEVTLIEWLTFGTAAVTAMATAASGYFLWRQNQRSAALDEPIVETTETSSEGEAVVFTLTVRNTRPASLVMESLAIRRPRRMKLYAGFGNHDGPRGEVTYPVPSERTHRFGWSIAPAGSRSTSAIVGSGGVERIRVAVLPPPGWSSGWVKFVLRMRLSSVNSRTIKVVFRKFIQHDANRMTEAMARSTD